MPSKLAQDLKAIESELSRAEAAHGMIAEDGRDPTAVAQEMKDCIRKAQILLGEHLSGGIEGDTDVQGDMTGEVG